MITRRKVGITRAIVFGVALAVTWHLANNTGSSSTAFGLEMAAYASALGTIVSLVVALVPSKRIAAPYEPQFDTVSEQGKSPE